MCRSWMLAICLLMAAKLQGAETGLLPAWANAVGFVSMYSDQWSGPAGSCTYFQRDDAGRAWVVTAKHVVGQTQRGRVTFPNGEWFPCEVAWRSSTADAAILLIGVPQKIAPIPLARAEDMPSSGDEVTMVGYGSGRGPRKISMWQAKVKGRGRRETDIAIYTAMIPGDSGGAAVYRGKLVGINWGGPTAGQRGPMIHSESVAASHVRAELNIFHGRPLRRIWPNRDGAACRPVRPSPGTIDVPSDSAVVPVAPPVQVRQGPPGERGEIGPRGPAGETPDVKGLADAIIKNLPPIIIEFSDGDPTTSDDFVSARLGETIILPPQRLRIRDGEKVFLLEEALGEAIKIKVEGMLSAAADSN